MRTGAVLLPLAPAVGAGLLAGALLPEPHGTAAVVGWWATVGVAAAAALVAADALARRLLPLAVLLELSLLFPDKAPSRFRTALRSGSSRRLRRLVLEAHEAGVEGDPSRAAAAILALVAALGAHHRPSQGHSERVRAFTDLISEELRLPPRDRHRLRWAALLHDVGKVVVPIATLNNRGPLTTEQWETIRLHPEQGRKLCEPLREWLGPWATAVQEHHERWDGLGYPNGLAGEEISLGGRIVCVADSFEAMTAHRTYQTAMTTEAARERLAELSGTQFDPMVVRAFLRVSVGRVRWALGPLAALAPLPLVGGVARAAPRVLAAGVKAGALGLTAGAVAAAGGPAPAPAPSAVTTTTAAVVARAPAPAATSVTATEAPPASPSSPTSPTPSSPSSTAAVTSGTTTTTTTAITLPPVTVPTVTVPTVTVPTVTVPTLTLPPASVPPLP
ncbi:MAG TPA: HD-GYP domain-containing protein [Acidimicrobiales bacterium]|nr:HD-GYP domain-containing protein [Acidimicrobiales bacterium]